MQRQSSNSTPRAVVAPLALCWVLFWLHALGAFGDTGISSLAANGAYSVLQVTAVALCLARGLSKRDERLPWMLMGLGLASWAVGDLCWTIAEATHHDVSSPFIGDILYLGFYAAAYAALVVLVRRRALIARRDLWLDGVIGASCAAAVAVAAVFPAFDVSPADIAATGINLAYPVLDVVLLVFVIMVVALSGWRPGRSWAVLGAGLVMMTIADVSYVVEATNGAYSSGGFIDSLWSASILIVALAAWQPSEMLGQPLGTDRRLVLIPFFCGLVALALVALGVFDDLAQEASALALMTLLLVTLRMAIAFTEAQRTLQENHNQAMTDGLTGLGNRRLLLADLHRLALSTTPDRPRICILLDLDGFKAYNDNFGHPAGDELLARLGQRLREIAEPEGTAYRLGGDEFCILTRCGSHTTEEMVAIARSALSETGEAFEITSSAGVVLIPDDALEPADVLHLADRRMYAEKGARASSIDNQSHAVLVRLLRERAPEMQAHHAGLTSLAVAVGRRLGMEGEEVDELARAVDLHDLGKIAIPETILNKPGPLDSEELSFIQRHPVIGERVLGAAPALRPVAKLVRATHERFDGKGYPDGLAGEQIPLGSRVVAVCEAYGAMLSGETLDRTVSSPEEAMAKLERRSGTRFDPQVVEALKQVVAETSLGADSLAHI
jgi:two-component system cell cycle response regulator